MNTPSQLTDSVDIRNLANFKQFFKKGGKLRILKYTMRPDMAGLVIEAKEVRSDHVYYCVFGEPTHKVSLVNRGRGMRMDFGRAVEYEFCGNTVKRRILNKDGSLRNEIHWEVLEPDLPQQSACA